MQKTVCEIALKFQKMQKVTMKYCKQTKSGLTNIAQPFIRLSQLMTLLIEVTSNSMTFVRRSVLLIKKGHHSVTQTISGQKSYLNALQDMKREKACLSKITKTTSTNSLNCRSSSLFFSYWSSLIYSFGCIYKGELNVRAMKLLILEFLQPCTSTLPYQTMTMRRVSTMIDLIKFFETYMNQHLNN